LKSSGFSLIELSVTLVIIGLIIAGVTNGQHLMQAAKLDKAITEISGYAKAIDNFKQKYKAFPGDMPNATSFWGAYDATTNPTGTANGNGDEFITWNTEGLTAWQQLAASGFITGKYTGVLGTVNLEAGVNQPESGITGTSYSIQSDSARVWNVTNYRYLGLAKISSDGSANNTSAISAQNAQLIDKKIDDGLPGTGKILGVTGSGAATACTSPDWSTATSTGSYLFQTDLSLFFCRVWYVF
jgi:prepilin-type N-terminal cleavage/methylation domain-containing protein